MKNQNSKPVNLKNAIAHQKLWNVISDQDSSQLKGGDKKRGTLFVGTIRTTFTF